jgi:hypothetical protein
MDPNLFPYLREQFSKARPILFLGAGFSAAADSIEGSKVASSAAVKERLWSFTFPDDLFDDSSSLQSVFEGALMRHRDKIKPALSRILSVKPDTLPSWYQLYYSFPWYKCYTLNIDDLALAAARKYTLKRPLNAVSGVVEHTANQKGEADFLNIIHLNGNLDDLPDRVTFSLTQYAERLANMEPVYVRLVSELVSHPFVFVGTKLEEPPLWQHLAMRAQKGGKVRELRKRSYLVTPSLDKARQVALSQFNIEWLPLDAEHFAVDILAKLTDAAEEGQVYLSGKKKQRHKDIRVTELSEIEIDPYKKTDFLLGEEPSWSDIQKGHAIERQADRDVWELAQKGLQLSPPKGLLCITGTSGCGKSTSLMRLALRLSSSGLRVGWINSTSDLAAHELVKASENQRLQVLAIDESDFLGSELNSLARELTLSGVFVIVAMRSNRVDRIINPAILDGIPIERTYLEDLTDNDIEELLDVLDHENRLGGYRGLTRKEQIARFRADTGRQLLIGMIKATSGERLEEKVPHEFEQLGDLAKLIYGAVCVANYLGGFLTRQDALIVTDLASNESLNCIATLIDSRLIAIKEGSDDDLRARHRVVAELVFKHLQVHGGLLPILTGIAIATASKVRDNMPTRAKPRRLLMRLISHDFLIQIMGPEQARNFYASLETALKSYSHYWLQRGCLELEYDNLRLAENMLLQAKALVDHDYYVLTVYAHLLFKKACHQPNVPESKVWISEAEVILESVIKSSAANSTKPYHIYGSQGLSWARRGLKTFEEKRDYLDKLRRIVSAGTDAHPNEEALRQLRKDIEGEILGLALRR